MVLEDVLHAHPISEQRMKEVLGHTPLQARSEPSSMHACKLICQRHHLMHIVTYLNVATACRGTRHVACLSRTNNPRGCFICMHGSFWDHMMCAIRS